MAVQKIVGASHGAAKDWNKSLQAATDPHRSNTGPDREINQKEEEKENKSGYPLSREIGQ